MRIQYSRAGFDFGTKFWIQIRFCAQKSIGLPGFWINYTALFVNGLSIISLILNLQITNIVLFGWITLYFNAY